MWLLNHLKDTLPKHLHCSRFIGYQLPDSAISASLQSIQENVNDERRLSLWH